MTETDDARERIGKRVGELMQEHQLAAAEHGELIATVRLAQALARAEVHMISNASETAEQVRASGWRREDDGSEYGRLLAQRDRLMAERDRLIAEGVDPDELDVQLVVLPPAEEPHDA